MPNNCENDLWVSGDPATVQEFINFAKENYHDRDMLLSFNKFIPYPWAFASLDDAARKTWDKIGKMSGKKRQAYLNKHDLPKDGFNQGGYEWCNHNWGTKWPPYEERPWKVSKNKKTAFITFQTAWKPPTPVIVAMSAKFPTLTFRLKYYERGCCYKGVYEVKGGVILEDTMDDYHGPRGG